MAEAALLPREDHISDALDAMDQGFLWLDQNLLAFLHTRGEFLESGEQENFMAWRLRALRAGEPYRIERVRPNGVLLSVAAVPLAAGGYVYTYLDVTRESRALDEVQRPADRCRHADAVSPPRQPGGINVLVLYLQERFGWRAGKVQMGFDCLIVQPLT